MEQSPEIDQLAAALACAQQMIEHAEKDAANPAFRSRYASLGAVIDAVKPALNGQGLSFVQGFEPAEEGHLRLTTMLLHRSGQWLRSTCLMPLAKADPQGYGSATTYARRYGLMAICGIAAEDDDGNAASAPRPAQGQQNAQPREGRWNNGSGRQESRGDAHAAQQQPEAPRGANAAVRPGSYGQQTGAANSERQPMPVTNGFGAPAPGALPLDESTLICSGVNCGKAITGGQKTMSERAFGRPLCAACQKEEARRHA